MKYYIPTSSLNIENILSSESISPVSYYVKRPFGSKFFQGISDINMDDTLYLFSKVPQFSISDSESEQYPIALEIDDEQLKKLEVSLVYDGQDFKIISCSKTIVLTPWNTRIFYFDERAYIHSRLVLETSRNCKLGLRFQWVCSDEGVRLRDMVEKINGILPGDGPDDLGFNAGKGAVWGYIVGCSRSISTSAAQLVSISNRMRNIASNAISNSGECGQVFYDELNELEEKYRNIADKETHDKWNQACSQEKRSILVEFDVLKEAFNKFSLPYTPKVPYMKDSQNAWVSYREGINACTEAYIKDSQMSSTISLNSITYRNSGVTIENSELINCVLNMIMLGELDKEKIRISREASMKNVLGSISEILQRKLGKEKWGQQPDVRLYINKLYKNIVDFEPFDINDINDEELKAIAAFLLKGEDFEALLRYLEDNCVANYRYILCLWGALEGYASIHKTILAPVLSADNVCQVNKLLGVQNTTNSFPSEVHIFNRREREDTGVHSIMPKESADGTYLVETFANFLSGLTEKCKRAKNDEELYRKLFMRFGLTPEFYDAVDKESSFNGGKGIQKGAREFIEKEIRLLELAPKSKRRKSKRRSSAPKPKDNLLFN